jgi:hypothetical protein
MLYEFLHSPEFMCLFLALDNLVSESKVNTHFRRVLHGLCPSQWQRGLRRGSVDVRVLELLVPIPPGAWIVSLVSVVCCRVLCSLRRADHSCRGVLLSIVCLSVIVRIRQ